MKWNLRVYNKNNNNEIKFFWVFWWEMRTNEYESVYTLFLLVTIINYFVMNGDENFFIFFPEKFVFIASF